MAKKKIRKPYRKPTRSQPPRACKRTYATVPDQHDEQCRSLDQLPEDVLLVVMQHLDVDDLLACRLVCWRLGALALHRDAWTHRTLSTSSCDKNRLTCPVLRLAPCLHHVTVVLPLLKSVCGHVYTTTCAVEGLEVRDHVDLIDYGAGVHGVRLIKNQATLGRLRRVVLKFHRSTLFEAAASTLFGALVSTPGLEQLRLTAWLDRRFAFKTGTQFECAPSSMRRFHIAIKGAEDFIQLVLRTHEATLEEVHIVGIESSISIYYRISASTLQLVAGLPSLRVVSLHHDQPGLRVLAGSETLRTLKIVVGKGEKYSAVAVDRLLRARPALEVKIIRGANHEDC